MIDMNEVAVELLLQPDWMRVLCIITATETICILFSVLESLNIIGQSRMAKLLA